MAAKWNFHRRCEPTEVIDSVALSNKERGLRKIIFFRYRLKFFIRQPGFQRHNCRRIALKRARREGVDLSKFELHLFKMTLHRGFD